MLQAPITTGQRASNIAVRSVNNNTFALSESWVYTNTTQPPPLCWGISYPLYKLLLIGWTRNIKLVYITTLFLEASDHWPNPWLESWLHCSTLNAGEHHCWYPRFLRRGAFIFIRWLQQLCEWGTISWLWLHRKDAQRIILPDSGILTCWYWQRHAETYGNYRNSKNYMWNKQKPGVILFCGEYRSLTVFLWLQKAEYALDQQPTRSCACGYASLLTKHAHRSSATTWPLMGHMQMLSNRGNLESCDWCKDVDSKTNW